MKRLHILLLPAGLMTTLACKSGSEQAASVAPEPSADAARVAEPEPAEPDCEPTSKSNVPGVTLKFAEDARCSFTVEEAKAGIQFPYVLVIEEAHEVTPRPQDSGGCQGPLEHGLSVFEKISGTDDTWCICDEGLCEPSSQKTTLKPGTYEASVNWDGVNWTGPSDFGNPKGEPFGPGAYEVVVSAEGTLHGDQDQRFRVSATLPFVLRDDS